MIDTVCAESIELAAGPLSMVFEPANAMLRYVHFGDIELIRGVFAAVRDQDWDTVPFTVHEIEHKQSSDQFSLTFLVRCSRSDIQFEWTGRVTGTPAGVVRFDFQGQAKSTFLKNRIGLCVLHPINECAGQRCQIAHTDQTTTEDRFPKWISPHQPFKNIRSMTHDLANGLQARVTFAGDVFETEDQRNWTDASYKTYCTPLELPFPVEIAAGSQIVQSVTIELCGDVAPSATVGFNTGAAESNVNVTVNWDLSRATPPIGLSMATCHERATIAVIDRLREIKPAHLRVDLHLDRDDWAEHADSAIQLASQIDTKLEVALFTEHVGNDVWTDCLLRLQPVLDKIASWLVFHPTAKSTPDELAESANSTLQNLSSTIPVVVGTNAYFAELNRNRPDVPHGCLVCYSINPQVHAFDNYSLCETLQAHRWTVYSAQQYFGTPVVISPITLRPRFNPNATSNSDQLATLEPESDPRQNSQFAAAWTVGVLAQLASHPNVASLTFYETFGPRGIMNSAGEVYPLTSVFAAINGSSIIFKTTNNAPLEVAAVALQRGKENPELLLANMSARPQTVCVNGVDGRELRWCLDAETVQLVKLVPQE